VHWALEEMTRGINTENVLIVSSFSKPIAKIDIEDYVSAALVEVNQEEYYSKYSLKSNIHFHVNMIIEGIEVKRNLANLHELAINNNYPFDIYPFYLIYNALDSFKYDNVQFYYDGLTQSNWKELLDKEAKEWIQTQIENKRPYELNSLENEIELRDKTKIYELEKGQYKIYILGGWYVKLSEFKIDLINKTTKRKVEIEERFLKEQSYINGKRAKQIWTFQIDREGIYAFTLSNANSIVVKRSNLEISNFILRRPEIRNEKLKLRIVKR